MSREEFQTHGYEVDVVATNRNSLILGSVKSFLGSQGVSRRGFRALNANSNERENNAYRIFNDTEVRDGIIKEATDLYRYPRKSVEVRLFVGKFKSEDDQREIAEHFESINDRGVKFGVVGLSEIVDGLLCAAESGTT